MSKSQTGSFTERVKRLIKAIPKGQVAAYGQIAAYAGDPRGARQVARILHACSDKDNLPWYRVINRSGRISLPRGQGHETQRSLLRNEAVRFRLDGAVDLERHLWQPKDIDKILR
jgi:methylated-DNA-protein-cysteine methyltransferase-like protein